jgi:hypothetical protein
MNFVRDILKGLDARQKTFAYASEHPEWFQRDAAVHNIDAALIIGAPRTGSTILHRLLALDDTSITPRLYEMFKWEGMLPPFDPKVDKERYEALKSSAAAESSIFPDLMRQFNESHPTDMEEPDEELFIFAIGPLFACGLILVCLCKYAAKGTFGQLKLSHIGFFSNVTC